MTIDLKKLKELQDRLNTGGGQGGDSNFLDKFIQFKVGNTLIRILPGKEEESFFAETKIHRIPVGEGKTKNFHCLTVHGKECPVCKAYYSLWDMHNALNLPGKERSKYSEAARKIKPTPRFYMNALVRSTDGEGEVPKILSVGKKLFDQIVGAMIQFQEDEMGDMLDLQEGFDFKVVKVMLDQFPNYDQSSARMKATPVAKTKKATNEIMGSLHNLTELPKKEDYEEAKKIADTLLALYVPQRETSTEGEDNGNDYDYLGDTEV